MSGVAQVPQSGGCSNGWQKLSIIDRQTSQTVQNQPFLLDRELPSISIEDRTEGIARDDFSTAGAVPGGEPGGQAAKLRYDHTVMPGDQCKDPADRQPFVDPRVEVSSRQELGDLPVNGRCRSMRRRFEQSGSEDAAQYRSIVAGYLLKSRRVSANLVAGESEPLTPGQELDCAKPSCRVHQGGDIDHLPHCCAMIRVVLLNESPTGHVEGLDAGFWPALAPAQSQREHSQALGIGQQRADALLAGSSDECVRFFQVKLIAQDVSNIVIGQRIHAQNRNLAVTGYGLQVIPVICPEPVCLATGEAEPWPS